jgi:hypothetical protein
LNRLQLILRYLVSPISFQNRYLSSVLHKSTSWPDCIGSLRGCLGQFRWKACNRWVGSDLIGKLTKEKWPTVVLGLENEALQEIYRSESIFNTAIIESVAEKLQDNDSLYSDLTHMSQRVGSTR